MHDNGIISSESWQSLAPSDVAAIRHWFVESGASYVGPMEIGEVERLWHAREIDEQTRVWTEGMSTWMSLGDVPDLMYLVIEQPQVAPPAKPEWQTTAAASLASLVESELHSLEDRQATVAAPVTASMPELPALQPIDTSDPFGRWWSGPVPAPAAAPFPADPWRGRQVVTRTAPRWRLGAGIAGAAAVLVLVFALIASVAGDDDRVVAPEPASAAARPGGDEAAAAVATARAREPAAQAPGTSAAPASEAPAAPAPASSPARAATTSPAAATTPIAAPAAPSKAPAVARADEPARAAPSAPVEADAGEDEEEVASGLDVSRPLTPQEVMDATRAQAKVLASCIKQARMQGELESQRYTFVLDWRIRPNGSVADAELKGPAEVLDSGLGRCFQVAMRRWRFRQSPEDFQVRNFPLPVTVR